jgi:hypothetical protein
VLQRPVFLPQSLRSLSELALPLESAAQPRVLESEEYRRSHGGHDQ